MNLIKQTISINEITAIKHTFLSHKWNITNEEIARLITYQNRVLEKLEWIETDTNQLLHIIEPFLSSFYLNENNYLPIIKKVISCFYLLRQSFDYHSSDNDIIETMVCIFHEQHGQCIDALFTSAKTRLKEEGGYEYHEYFKEY